MEESLVEEVFEFEEEYRFVKKIGTKLIYAHTTYHAVEEPDYEKFVTEDDTPVDNIFSEIQQRLLIDPLHSNQWTERNFWASSNVGIYYAVDKPPVVPDMFLSFDVRKPETWFDKKDKCYFTWIAGKSPELVVEVVSNTVGKEDTDKMSIYAHLGVKYYVLIDPYYHLDKEKKQRLKVLLLNDQNNYEVLESPFFMEEVNLGIMIWEDLFEGEKAPWARWCSKEGTVLMTGAESAEHERQKAELEKQKAEEEKQKAELEKQKAEEEKQKAELEKQKAEEERQRADEAEKRTQKLLAQLKALGLSPEL